MNPLRVIIFVYVTASKFRLDFLFDSTVYLPRVSTSWNANLVHTLGSVNTLMHVGGSYSIGILSGMLFHGIGFDVRQHKHFVFQTGINSCPMKIITFLVALM